MTAIHGFLRGCWTVMDPHRPCLCGFEHSRLTHRGATRGLPDSRVRKFTDACTRECLTGFLVFPTDSPSRWEENPCLDGRRYLTQEDGSRSTVCPSSRSTVVTGATP